MPQLKIKLHGIAPQINVAILQAHLFVRQNSFAGQKRGLLCFVQNAQLFRNQFNLAGRNVFVDRVGITQLDLADRRYHILVAQKACLLVNCRVQFLVADNLGDARAIAHVNEDKIAQIAAAIDPSHEHGFLAGIGGAQRAAHVSTS